MNIRLATYLIAVALLLGTLGLHLVPALLAGSFSFILIRGIAGRLAARMSSRLAQQIAVIVVAALVVVALTVAGTVATRFLVTDGFGNLLQQLADIVQRGRYLIPDSVSAYLPADVESLRGIVVGWLKQHASEVTAVGGGTLHSLVHVLMGLLVGAIASFAVAQPSHARPATPFLSALARRLEVYAGAFGKFIFAQLKIAGLNALLTGLYLLVALPLADVRLPHAEAMVLVTFVVGMLPIVGNLISNTVITVVSLGHSPVVALASLGFLVLIHKLEYFVNARIVGGSIEARAWEILVAMLIMEAAFGFAGLAFAPIAYAYLKAELREAGLA